MPSAMCGHQQQFQRDEKHQAINLILNIKTNPGCGSGLDVFQMPPQQQAPAVSGNKNIMQRILLLSTFLFAYDLAFGQNMKFTIDLEVGYLRFKNDSVQFKTPNNFSISTSGCTEIFSLGKSRRYEFGMRVEILVSKLTGGEKYLVGKVYYVKNDNQWQEIMKIEHRELEVRPFAQRERTDMFITGGGSIDYPDAFDVRLNDNYYRIQ